MLHNPMLTLGPAATHVQPARRTESLAVRIFDTLFQWMERAQSRRALASLTDAQLADIGLSRAEALSEVDKGFWRR